MNSPQVKHRTRAGSEGASPDSVSVSSDDLEEEDEEEEKVVREIIFKSDIVYFIGLHHR